MFAALTESIAHWLATGGYPALVGGMALEAVVAPVPSELLMTFAGYLIAQGQWTWPGVVLWSTVGSLLGSLLLYAIGRYAGRPAVERWGRRIGIGPAQLAAADSWFATRGGWAVVLCRFVPLVRHLISVPAGLARMPLWRFLGLSAIGSSLWNTLLAVVGYSLGSQWRLFQEYSSQLDYAVLAALLAAAAWWWLRRRRSIVRG